MRRWWVWASLALAAGLYLACVTDELGDLGGDTASYLLLAQSLLDGHGYRSLESPTTPRHTRYPFVWPVMLMPLIAVAGIRYGVLHLAVVVLMVVALGLSWRWWRRWVGPAGSLAGLWLLAFALCWMTSASMLFAEIPYTVWSLGVLLLVEPAIHDPRACGSRWWSLALLLWLAVFTRTIGLVLVIAVVIRLLVAACQTHRWSVPLQRLILLGATVLVPVALWWWWVRSEPSPSGATYLEQAVYADFYAVQPMRLTTWAQLVERMRQQWLFYRYEVPLQVCAGHELLSPVPGVTLWLV